MKTQQNKHEVVIRGQKVGEPESPLARAPGGGWQKCNLSYATLKTQFTAETVRNGGCLQKLSSDLSKRIISRMLRLLRAQTILTRPTLCYVAHFFPHSHPILWRFHVANITRSDVSIPQFHFFCILFAFSWCSWSLLSSYVECLICLSDLYSNGKMWDLKRYDGDRNSV